MDGMLELSKEDVMSLTHVLMSAARALTAKKYRMQRKQCAVGLKILFPRYHAALTDSGCRPSERAACEADVVMLFESIFPGEKI